MLNRMRRVTLGLAPRPGRGLNGQEQRELGHVTDVAHVSGARCECRIATWKCELDGRIESFLKEPPCPNDRSVVSHTNSCFINAFDACDAQRHLLPQEIVDIAAQDDIQL